MKTCPHAQNNNEEARGMGRFWGRVRRSSSKKEHPSSSLKMVPPGGSWTKTSASVITEKPVWQNFKPRRLFVNYLTLARALFGWPFRKKARASKSWIKHFWNFWSPPVQDENVANLTLEKPASKLFSNSGEICGTELAAPSRTTLASSRSAAA
jgi:hypothetical protein